MVDQAPQVAGRLGWDATASAAKTETLRLDHPAGGTLAVTAHEDASGAAQSVLANCVEDERCGDSGAGL